MNIPGFTAEATLGRSSQHYATEMSSTQDSQVTPAFNITCYLNSYFRTYGRCTSIGHGEGVCRELADDVAGSACR
jgi:hypothetical protein